MKAQFSTYDAFAFSFKKCADNFLFLILTTIMALAAAIIPLGITLAACMSVVNICAVPMVYTMLPDFLLQLVDIFFSTPSWKTGLILLVLLLPSLLVASGIFLGYKHMLLEMYDKGESSFRTLFTVFARAPQFLGAAVLVMILLFVAILVPVALLQAVFGFFTDLPLLFTWLFGNLVGLFLYYVFLRVGFFPLFMIDLKMGPIDALRMSLKVTHDQLWSLVSFALVAMVIFSALNGFGIFFVPLAWVYVYRQLMTDRL
jgi:hypothetical protein